MRPSAVIEHPTLHTALTNVTHSQHHLRPSNLTILNNTLVVYPLPGGPNDWNISVPFDTIAAVISLRSVHRTELSGGMAGAIVVVTRSMLEASSFSLGGHGTLTSAAYNAIYSKASSALNLSHKVFASTGMDIALTEAYLTLTGPTTRILRLTWTNYSAGLRTLDARGEVELYT